MGELKLYGKGLLRQIKQDRMLPPNISQQNPEQPTSRIPILGVPTAASDSTENYVCQKCKKSFNSKDELQLHMETDHKTRKIPAQQ